MIRWLAAAALGLAAALVPAAAVQAHSTGSTGYAEVIVEGQAVRYSLSLPVEVLPAEMLAGGVLAGGVLAGGAAADLDRLAGTVAAKVSIAADGRACAPVPSPSAPPAPGRATVQVVVLYACGGPVGELVITDAMSDVLGPGHHTLADVEWSGGRQQRVFETGIREARISLDAATGTGAGGAPGSFVAYLGLGIEHILLGFDHVLFVVALILRGGRVLSMLAILTAFTLAHSVTLALSVLDVVTLPAQIVEPVIALSIAYVAAENIVLRDPAASRRWALGFLFGLVHGFGFAGGLREAGLPADSLAGALLGFNLGVEAGQAFIVAALLPALLWFRRFAWQHRVVQVSSAAIVAAGLLLLVERVLAL